MNKRIRRVGSIKNELLKKSREAALAAVQIFNNPNISFKSESYIVLMIIAWTYLLHAYFREQKIEYRHSHLKGTRREFIKTKYGAYKYWELEHCLNEEKSPLDKDTTNNLRFLIGLRHEIEHQMTTRIDDMLSARFQACCLNYNDYRKKLFGQKMGLKSILPLVFSFRPFQLNRKTCFQSIQSSRLTLKATFWISTLTYQMKNFPTLIMLTECFLFRKQQIEKDRLTVLSSL